MKRKLYKILSLVLVLVIIIEVSNIIYIKNKNEEKIINYYKNNTNYNYKDMMILKIPSIKLNYTVEKADNDFGNLNNNLVYYNKNNYEEKIIIFGHSGMGFGTYFNRIDELGKGVEAKLYINEEEITYVFDQKSIISSRDIAVLLNDEKKVLLLITCDKSSKKKRLVVRFTLKGHKNVKK